MDIAVISDIHGNYKALEAVLDIVIKRNINTFFFLGDYVGELAYPQKTMDIIYHIKDKYNCYFVKGNKEDYWLNYRKNGEQGWKDNDSTTGSLLYTYTNLREKDMNFFKALSYVQDVNIKGYPKVTICHGSPNRANEKLIPNDENTFNIMKNNESDYILCGHTHIQGKITYGNKVALNPGSVGVSLNSNGKAQFIILHGTENGWSEEFISTDYDVAATISELHESGLYNNAPCWSKITENLLLHGDISHRSVLTRAMDLCKNDMSNCIWPDIPEKYWKQAVKEIIG